MLKRVTAILLLSIFALFTPASALAAGPISRTSTQYSVTSSSKTEVIPYLVLSRSYNVLVLDIQRANFKNVEYIHYNVNYNTSDSGNLRGAEGTFYPWMASFNSRIMYYQNQQFVRQSIPLGSCSRNVCRYDSNPSNIKVTVYTKYVGKEATETTAITVSR
jgi:hypothetical protein